MSQITNILTIDLEDYFQVSAFESVVKREDWDKFESRLERNTYRLLEILEESGKAPGVEGTAVEANGTIRLPPTSNLQPPAHLDVPPTSNLRPSPNCSSTPCPLPLAPNGPVRATFFCLGWNAERYPRLIRDIHAAGHEIASHGYDHRLVYNMTPSQFRQDIRKSKLILEDTIGEEVVGYRAPSYSITKKSLWAFEILGEERYVYDSSIFPIHHDRYGFPNAHRFPFSISLRENRMKLWDIPHLGYGNRLFMQDQCEKHRHNSIHDPCITHIPFPIILEFPISTARILGQNLPISGGGYFRLFPYILVEKGLRRINEEENKPFIFYIHPWELDIDQPRFNNGSRLSKFRHYVNLRKTEKKFTNLLMSFRFSSVRQILERYSKDKIVQSCTLED